ncbi:MAG TPA: NAD(P)H-dependent oxidoreductase subunit E [Armatimonadota bacterium]
MNDSLSGPNSTDLAALDKVIAHYAGENGSLIPILQQAQDIFGYLPRSVMSHIARKTRTPLQQVFGVATFYSQFYLSRRGRHIVKQCDGTACHVRGAGKIIDTIASEFEMHPGETTDDFKYTFEVVYCLGSCGLAPVAVVDEKVIGRLAPKDLVRSIRNLE